MPDLADSPRFWKLVQGAALLVAPVFLLMGVQEASAGGERAGLLFGIRFALALLFITSVLPLGSPRLRDRKVAVLLLILSGVLANVPSAVFLEGTSAPAFWFLAGLPLYAAIVLHDPFSIGLTSTAVLGGGAAIVAMAPEESRYGFPWLLQVLASTTIGLFAATGHRRMAKAHAVEQAERLASAQRLAALERQRGEEERLAIAGRMVAGVAHEINNPLAVVRANVEFLSKALSGDPTARDPEEEREVLAEMQASAVRIQRLVSAMQSFTQRMTHGGACSVAGVLEPAIRLARAGAASAVHIELSTDGSRPHVRMDPVRLEQVVLSLLLNAADAVAEARPAKPRIEVSLATTGEEVRIRVRDNGTGIAAEHLPRLFEPFFTTKPPGKGTGLALALAREFLADAGGRITVENAPDGGAVVEVRLPAVSSSPSSGDPARRGTG